MITVCWFTGHGPGIADGIVLRRGKRMKFFSKDWLGPVCGQRVLFSRIEGVSKGRRGKNAAAGSAARIRHVLCDDSGTDSDRAGCRGSALCRGTRHESFSTCAHGGRCRHSLAARLPLSCLCRRFSAPAAVSRCTARRRRAFLTRLAASSALALSI